MVHLGVFGRVLVGIVALALACCERGGAEIPYSTAVAEIGDVRDVVPATGTLVARGAAEIRAPRAGVIAAVYVNEGDVVRAGQVLASMTTPRRVPSQNEARALEAAAAAATREARVILQAAEQGLARSRTLQERGFVSATAVANAETEVEQARAALQRLTSEEAAARARTRLNQAEGTEADIIAPLSGVVTLVDARVGQQVSPEDERALFQTVQDEKDMILEIMISEADLQRVSLESRVVFTVDALPGITEQAQLVSIGRAPIRDGRFVSYRAVAEYDNAYSTFRSGMSASVQLIRADARNVLRIPIEATYYQPADYMPPLPPGRYEELLRRFHGDRDRVRAHAQGLQIGRGIRNGTRVVFVLVNGEPKPREIRIGAETDEFLEVTEGLNAGDIVIVNTGDDPRDSV